jgi:hypothetical protein
MLPILLYAQRRILYKPSALEIPKGAGREVRVVYCRWVADTFLGGMLKGREGNEVLVGDCIGADGSWGKRLQYNFTNVQHRSAKDDLSVKLCMKCWLGVGITSESVNLLTQDIPRR